MQGLCDGLAAEFKISNSMPNNWHMASSQNHPPRVCQPCPRGSRSQWHIWPPAHICPHTSHACQMAAGLPSKCAALQADCRQDFGSNLLQDMFAHFRKEMECNSAGKEYGLHLCLSSQMLLVDRLWQYGQNAWWPVERHSKRQLTSSADKRSLHEFYWWLLWRTSIHLGDPRSVAAWHFCILLCVEPPTAWRVSK